MTETSKRRRGSSPLGGHTDSNRMKPHRPRQQTMSPGEGPLNDKSPQTERSYRGFRERMQNSQTSCLHPSSSAYASGRWRIRRSSPGGEFGLKGHLAQRNNQRRIIALAATDSVRLSGQRIQLKVELIATHLKDACSSVEITIPSTSLDTSAEAEAWAQRTARRNFSQFLASATGANVENFHIARALAAASINELVFESRFPDFLQWKSPVLD